MSEHVKAPAPFELTFSFERDPSEHVDVMFAAGRRFQQGARTAGLNGISIVIGFGLLLGIVMELHRRYLLPAWFGGLDFLSFGQMVIYFLPAFLVVGMAVWMVIWRRFGLGRVRLEARIRPKVLVGVDLSRAGVRMTTDDIEIFIHWSSIRNMEMSGSLILMDAETFTVYIPERAFADHKAFVAGFHQIQTLWRHGMKNELQSRELLR